MIKQFHLIFLKLRLRFFLTFWHIYVRMDESGHNENIGDYFLKRNTGVIIEQMYIFCPRACLILRLIFESIWYN